MKSQGRDSQKRAEQLEEVAEQTESVDYEPEQVEVELHASQDFGVKVLAARNIHKSFEGREVLEGADLTVVHGDKIGLLGPNGCGKTTLLEIIVGHDYPDAGRVEEGEKTEIAYMPQEAAEFDPEATVYDAFSDSDYVWVGDVRHHKRDFLENFLFDRDDQKKLVSTLSGGQVRRLQLARVVGENANVILLDEPTNNLDIASMQALEEALRDFEGCVIAVSHDRYFLNRICNTIVAFEEGEWNRYRGNYDEYQRQKDLAEEKGTSDGEAGANAGESADSDGDPEPNDGREGLSYDERRELESMEERIVEAETRKEELEEQLADPELYENRGDEVPGLNAELEELESRIDDLYDRWEELESRR